MEFLRRNINKQLRNGEIIAYNNTTYSFSNKGASSSNSNMGSYLPAISNGDGTYTVDLTQVIFNGDVIAQGEVAAYLSGLTSGETSGGTNGTIVIEDNLTSTASTAALSANQGRVLKNLIDNIDVDVDLSNYYTKSQVDAKLSNVNVDLSDYVKTSTFNSHTANTTAHITAAERTNWNAAYTNNHTHSNKSVLDGITSTKVANWDKVYEDWNDVFEINSDGSLKVKVNVIGEGEISAYGSGLSESSSGAITIVDNLTSTATTAALSANQGRVLKNLIDNIDVSGVDIDLSDYSKTSHTHSNYSLTSHTHAQYASSSHTHPISAITSLQSTLDGKSGTGHSHSNYSLTSHSHSNYSVTSHTHSLSALTSTAHTHSIYYDSTISRTANTVLAAPNGKAGGATFRTLVAADIPTLAISKITNLQSSLDGKSGTGHSHSNYSLTSHSHSNYSVTSHTHNYAGSSSAGGAATSANKVNSTLTFSGGTFATKSFNGSAAVTVNVPTHTSHITNNSGYITTAATVAAANKVTSTLTFTGGTFAAKTFNGSAAATVNIPTHTSHITNNSGYITTAATVTNADKLDGYHGSSANTANNYVLRGSSGQINVGAISSSSNITASGEITAHSDKRLKDNIQPLTNRGYITPTTYIKDGKESIGFIAQDMQKLYPELVIVDESTEEKYLSVNYMQYTAVLQAQIIELQEQLNSLWKIIKEKDIY